MKPLQIPPMDGTRWSVTHQTHHRGHRFLRVGRVGLAGGLLLFLAHVSVSVSVAARGDNASVIGSLSISSREIDNENQRETCQLFHGSQSKRRLILTDNLKPVLRLL